MNVVVFICVPISMVFPIPYIAVVVIDIGVVFSTIDVLELFHVLSVALYCLSLFTNTIMVFPITYIVVVFPAPLCPRKDVI